MTTRLSLHVGLFMADEASKGISSCWNMNILYSPTDMELGIGPDTIRMLRCSHLVATFYAPMARHFHPDCQPSGY